LQQVNIVFGTFLESVVTFSPMFEFTNAREDSNFLEDFIVEEFIFLSSAADFDFMREMDRLEFKSCLLNLTFDLI
jgi:hypothetical protein